MHRHSRIGTLVLLLAGSVHSLGTPTAAAQEAPPPPDSRRASGLRLDARAGIAIPTADLRNYVDEGLVLGTGLSYHLNERFAARADWTAALMPAADRRPFRSEGADVPPWGSETDLHHLTAGLQVELSEPDANIEVRAHGGTGVTFLSTEETELAEGGHFAQFTLDGGLELAVRLGDNVRFVGRGDVYVLPFRAGAPEHLWKEVTLPFTGGLAVEL